MLERATSCFESGGSRLLRGRKRCFRSRRMLHSSFWHHGAVDLDLPAWWATVLQPTTAAGQETDGRGGGVQHHASHDALFLDFLYPAKTLALMRRITTYGWESLRLRHTRASNGVRVRQFSSTAIVRRKKGNTPGVDGAGNDGNVQDSDESENGPFPPPVAGEGGYDHDSIGEDGLDAFDADPSLADETSPMPLPGKAPNKAAFQDSEATSDALEEDTEIASTPEELQEMLSADEADHRLVWKIYRSLDAESRTPEISADVLQFLGSIRPFTAVQADRALQLYELLPLENRRASSYKCAIMAHLNNGDLGKAALVHKQAIEVKKLNTGDFGTAELLAYAINKEQWQLAAEAYRAANAVSGVFIRYWTIAQKKIDLLRFLDALLIYARRLRRRSQSANDSERLMGHFIVDFADQAIRQSASRISSPSDQLQLWRCILRLKFEGLLRSRHFEYAIKGMAGQKIMQSDEVPELVRRIYQMYISAAKSGSVEASQSPLYSMLLALTKYPRSSKGTRLRLGQVISDWHRLLGDLNFAAVRVLMTFYSRKGDVAKVENYFNDLLRVADGVNSVDIFRPLLEVHARRGDVDKTLQHFSRITQEFGLQPDVGCWNLLLLAHMKQDDLEGACKRFDEMVWSGVQPDAYSFSAVLNLMAQRGDVEGVKEMLVLASEIDASILRAAEVVGYVVSAHIQNDDIPSAETLAEELRKRKEDGHLTGSLTPVFNNLLTAHALQRDVIAARRIFDHMQEHDIQTDAFTYAALMQALALVHQTDAAYKLLRIVLPQKRIKRLALHYAIVMAGFINQRNYRNVWYVDDHRRKEGVRSTMSTRIAAIKASTLAEMQMQADKGMDRTALLERTERLLAATLQNNDPWELASEPQTGLGLTSIFQANESYLAFVIMAYGSRGSYDYVKRMFEEYMQRQRDKRGDPDIQPPMRMLTALMHTHLRNGKYEELQECWNLALSQASYTISLHAPVNATEASSLSAKDPETDETAETLRDGEMAPSRRHILSRPMAIYISALHAQGRYSDLISTTTSLLGHGYTFDNHTMNLYVQILARSGRIGSSFDICEARLMPNWHGWRTNYLLRRRYQRTRGWDYMDVRPNKTPRGEVAPAYRTMVMLAAAMKWVRKRDALGRARSSDGEILSEGLLRLRAPMTIAALEEMPYVEDDLQDEFLRDEMD
ncbi:uncharacterized protein K452DRAFT_362292 [Aplosporella prunicola CBS 121167]|uniref:Pentacotripeptide-repeat region of PRORP domain-containing protein n=1 Tax=Aplosporella prunicola CBS 121167 TaxID=1176127 RepID=A0A6A6B2A0_9PEZI|nr:uncharacterized protein K452DRAFT_362292 [Aplosporella prunicola CBS 121167]KAF2136861.1 hypothetical protein K452DRAFT_362292 [Aplosporella prunicola CBS 121167]